MADDESVLRRKILEGQRGWSIEAAYAYSLWLEDHGRLDDAVRILEEAIHEGPDWGNRGELACVSLLDNLEEAWKRVHGKLGIEPRIVETAHNGSYVVDWAAVLATITCSA